MPVLDLFWTMVMVFYFVLVLWLLVVVLRDVFGRDDLSTMGKVGWTVLVFFLPLVGSLVYLASHRSKDELAALPADPDVWRVAGGQPNGYRPVFHDLPMP